MDIRTEEVLKLIKSQTKIRHLLTTLCYLMIVGGILVYVYYAVNKTDTIKLVKDKADNISEYKTEKIMTNPRIKLQHNDGSIYDIKAKKAFHQTESEVILYDVFAEGNLGKITAGELEVSESGDHLIFTKNPVLILNRIDNKNE
jgi:hypothetical protein